MTKTENTKSSKAKNAVKKVKEAPKKIVEHTLTTAIQTVEKEKNKEKAKAKKQTSKKVAKIAEKVAKTTQISKSTTARTKAKRAVTRIKDSIKEALHPNKPIEFYYDKNKLALLTLIYSFMTLLVAGLGDYLALKGYLNCYCIQWVLIITLTLSLLAIISSIFVFVFPQKLAVVTNKSIKIDHNEPLLWQDVEYAEELRTNSYSPRSIIRLIVREDAKYNLTFMQVLCKKNLYTAFSIPLYAMTAEDVEKIRDLVKKHTKYRSKI
jgi:cytochrome c oxidase subunit IV